MLDTYAFFLSSHWLDWVSLFIHFRYRMHLWERRPFNININIITNTFIDIIAFTVVFSFIIFDFALASIFALSSPSSRQLACDLTFSSLHRSLFAFFVLVRQYAYSITLGQVRCGYFFSWILCRRLCLCRNRGRNNRFVISMNHPGWVLQHNPQSMKRIDN